MRLSTVSSILNVLHTTTAASRLHTTGAALAAALLATGACTVPDDGEQLSQTESAISVAGAVSSSCTTAVVLGLAKQIAEEVDCMNNGALTPLAQSSHLKFTSNAVMPYLHPSAKTSLVAAANSASLQVNSGYRTVAQQYLLYRWAAAHRCGISIAATPGTSNHESGRAVDLANWSSRVSTMAAHGWSHDVPGDSVHFDHLSSPDARGKDVLAFQRLWNRNHPTDKISTDGAYGPQTGARLAKAPATGFAKGACGAVRRVIEVVAVDGPDRVTPATQAHYVVTLQNNDTVDWPATARIVVADGTPSELYDSATWTSATEVGPVGTAIYAGTAAAIDLDVFTPAVETAATTQFAVLDGTRVIDTFDISVTVAAGATADQSADALDDAADADNNDPRADENGAVPEPSAGCTAGGGSGWALLGLPLIALRRRRRAAESQST